jgi:CheY-like chemotaxis protein
MASLGTLAAGMAHEINNPLTAVVVNLHVAERALASAEAGDPRGLGKAKEAIGDAHEAAERVAQLVRNLKVFSRMGEVTRSAVDVRASMDTALRLVANEVRHRARIVREYADDVPSVDANEGRVGQVFMNLLTNAAHALPEGDASPQEIRVRIGRRGERVLVEVIDTGIGMTPEVLARALEPFFTTRPIGMGTGLGLSICHGIVRGLGGELSIESQPGSGTKVTVALPIGSLAPGPHAGGQAPPAPAPVRRGRILVVDDEPLVVKSFAIVLSESHEVTGTTSGRDALRRIAAGERYDAILCDLMMPDVTGMDVYAELAELAPDMANRTVFMTGGAFTARAQAFLEHTRNRTLQKPVSPDKLLELLEDMVSQRSDPS